VNRLFLIVDLLSIDSTIRWREFRGAGHENDLAAGLKELKKTHQQTHTTAAVHDE